MNDEYLHCSLTFVDNMESVVRETGDLAILLKAGIIQPEHFIDDLFSMYEQSYIFERKDEDLTIFKSVGHALENRTAVKHLGKYVNTNQN